MTPREVSIAQASIDQAQIEQALVALRQNFADERQAESAAWDQVRKALIGIAAEIGGLAGDCVRIAAEAEARHLSNIARLDALIGTGGAVKVGDLSDNEDYGLHESHRNHKRPSNGAAP